MRLANSIFCFLLFWLLSILLYAKVWNAGWVFDSVDWFNNFNTLQWSGFKVNFHDLAVRYFFDLVSLLVIKLFQKQHIFYFLLYTFLHSLAAWQWLTFLRLALKDLGSANNQFASYLAALLFLFSPYNTEVVVWRVGLIYLLTLNLLLLLLHLVKFFLDSGKSKWMLVYLMVYVCALLTHEIAMFFPFVFAVFVFKFYIQAQHPKAWKLSACLLFPSFVLIGFYLVLNKVVLGKWIGHYGASTHLNFDVTLLLSTFNKYVAKFALLSQFWKHEHKMMLYRFLEKPVVCYTTLVVYGIIALYLLLRRSIKLNGLILAGFTFAILIAPVLNLYFVDWMPIHGDRLGYVASAFFYICWAYFLLYVFNEAGYFFIVILLILELVSLKSILASWKESEKLMTNLHYTFEVEPDKEYCILAVADNFNGAYMYRCLSESPFAATMKLKSGKDITRHCIEVLKFNMVSVNSGIVVEKLSNNHLKLYFTEGGCWWWRYGQGATDFENEHCKVEIKNNEAYVLFKQKKQQTVYLFQQGNRLLKLNDF